MRIFIYILSSIFFTCCNTIDKQQLSEDDYLVFSVVLDTLFNSIDTTRHFIEWDENIPDEAPFEEHVSNASFKEYSLPRTKSYFIVIDSTRFNNTTSSQAISKNSFPNIMDDTEENFFSQNMKSYSITDSLFSNFNIKLLSNKKKPRWDKLSDKYPFNYGVVYFSKPGFNKDNTQAFIDIGFMQGRLSGYGARYLLEKQNNKWFILKSIVTWIS